MRAADGFIAIFVPVLGGGGAEMNAVRLANEWAKIGRRVVFLVRRRGGSYESVLHPGIEVVELLRRSVGSSTLGLLLSIVPLARWLDRHRPDVLLSVMAAPAVYATFAVLLARSKVRHVASIQNSVAAEYVGNVGWYRKVEFRLARLSFRKLDGVIALSAGVQQEVIEFLGVPVSKVHMIHNCGESLTKAAPDVDVGIARQRRFVILACGRLVRQKNYPLLLSAFSRLRNRQEVELWILGEGPLQNDLEELADSLGISDQVRFLGFRTPSSAYMRRADLFVLSSSWEGFANVIVEAMGAGVAVVSTDCPHGPREIIGSNEFGVLVPVDDADALANAAEGLLLDEDERARLVALGKSRAERFQPHVLAPAFLEALSKAPG